MSVFIDAILSPVNLVLTIMLAFALMYWLFVCFGAIDMDALDIDFDLDVDADVDAGHHALPGIGFLRFFNLGEVPLMVLLSVFLFVLWAAGILTYRYVGDWSVLLQLLLLVPMIIGSAILTKLATAPLKKVFKSLEESEHSGEIDFIGKRCTVASGTIDHKHGQVEVTTDGSPIKLNAQLEGSDESLPRGTEVVIVSYQQQTGVYRVRGF